MFFVNQIVTKRKFYLLIVGFRGNITTLITEVENMGYYQIAKHSQAKKRLQVLACNPVSVLGNHFEKLLPLSLPVFRHRLQFNPCFGQVTFHPKSKLR